MQRSRPEFSPRLRFFGLDHRRQGPGQNATQPPRIFATASIFRFRSTPPAAKIDRENIHQKPQENFRETERKKPENKFFSVFFIPTAKKWNALENRFSKCQGGTALTFGKSIFLRDCFFFPTEENKNFPRWKIGPKVVGKFREIRKKIEKISPGSQQKP